MCVCAQKPRYAFTIATQIICCCLLTDAILKKLVTVTLQGREGKGREGKGREGTGREPRYSEAAEADAPASQG